jgi:two-component system sensor histidine kinase YesM
MLLLSVAIYSMFSASAERNAAASSGQILDQVDLNLEYYMEGMTEISNLIRSNLATDPNMELLDIDRLLSTTSEIRSDIVTMAIYTSSGSMYTSYPWSAHDSNYLVQDQEWFKNTVNGTEASTFLPPHVQRIFADKRPWVVSLCSGVQVDGDRGPETWVVEVDMNFNAIEQLCQKVSLGKRGYIYIVDGSGNIIYHPQQQLIYLGVKEENIAAALSRAPGSYFDNFQGEQRIMTIKDMGYTGWRIVGISYVDELVENRQTFNDLLLFIMLFGLVFQTTASLFISAKITKPIKILETQMKKVEGGDIDVSLEMKGEYEIKRLSNTFNLMIARIRQLMEQSILEQETIRKSELKALQAQINPHFLYNTLDSIVWMNENRNYEGVSVMTNALAKFFRISISRGQDSVSVRDEIEHAKSYLIIQQIRYKNKFDFSIDAQPEVLEHRTQKLILQPIVENAIYHGVANLQEKGHILIKVAVENNGILFQIADNGYGIKPELLKGLLDRESKSEQGSGVGLKNVNERIKLYYGRQYGIEIISELEVGTTVNIRIPMTGCKEAE